jgi:hypothetical protein
MSADARRFPILEIKQVDERAFVEFWAARYPTAYEPIYQAHIGKPLTKKRLLELFRWKNNGPIAKHKFKSILRNYIESKPTPPLPGDQGALRSFISQPGGTIWRIFWLHCYEPSRYPIFDQHVYRAMRCLTGGRVEEIPRANLAKASAYVDQYLPFHSRFTYKNRKRVDQALWSYGKYLKSWKGL